MILPERKGKVIQCRGAEDRKSAETSSVNSGTGSLEAESIKGTAESTENTVKIHINGYPWPHGFYH